MRNKKGNVGLAEMPGIAITLVLIAAIFVAGFLVVSGLQDGADYSTDPLYSAAASNGCNTSDTSGCAIFGAAGNVTGGLTAIVNYAPTWGVIIGVAVLLGIVLIGFGFAKSRNLI